MNDFITRAVAYLKAVDASDAASHSIGMDEMNRPVLLPAAEGLALAYVVDEPQGLVYVQKRHLRAAGISEQQLHLTAMTNLGKLCADGLEVKKHGPIYGVFLDGNFEASLFVLESLWQRDLAHLVDKGYAICVPARDVLAFCDMDSQEGVATLCEMIGRVFDGGDHLLTRTIFRIRKKSV
jgi:uncharacterized protein YtpQ (UPF0354 family)